MIALDPAGGNETDESENECGNAEPKIDFVQSFYQVEKRHDNALKVVCFCFSVEASFIASLVHYFGVEQLEQISADTYKNARNSNTKPTIYSNLQLTNSDERR